jgi:hypothetical protein
MAALPPLCGSGFWRFSTVSWLRPIGIFLKENIEERSLYVCATVSPSITATVSPSGRDRCTVNKMIDQDGSPVGLRIAPLNPMRNRFTVDKCTTTLICPSEAGGRGGFPQAQ